jgi:hypothetical protein
VAGSLALTARDYARYGAQPDVAYLFESAAAELARSVAANSENGTVLLDERFTEGWPSVRFLLSDHPVVLFRPEDGIPDLSGGPAVVYVWPYGPIDFLGGIAPPASVEVSAGPLARGDLEPEAYPLYARYEVSSGATGESTANFDGLFTLRDAAVAQSAPGEIEVALQWQSEPAWQSGAEGRELPNLFIHVVGPEGMLAQYDGPLAGGLWPAGLWQPELSTGENHTLTLPRPFDPAHDSVRVGLYWPDSGERLPVIDEQGAVVDDQVIVRPGVAP